MDRCMRGWINSLKVREKCYQLGEMLLLTIISCLDQLRSLLNRVQKRTDCQNQQQGIEKYYKCFRRGQSYALKLLTFLGN